MSEPVKHSHDGHSLGFDSIEVGKNVSLLSKVTPRSLCEEAIGIISLSSE
jgi:hypothetical protein